MFDDGGFGGGPVPVDDRVDDGFACATDRQRFELPDHWAAAGDVDDPAVRLEALEDVVELGQQRTRFVHSYRRAGPAGVSAAVVDGESDLGEHQPSGVGQSIVLRDHVGETTQQLPVRGVAELSGSFLAGVPEERSGHVDSGRVHIVQRRVGGVCRPVVVAPGHAFVPRGRVDLDAVVVDPPVDAVSDPVRFERLGHSAHQQPGSIAEGVWPDVRGEASPGALVDPVPEPFGIEIGPDPATVVAHAHDDRSPAGGVGHARQLLPQVGSCVFAGR